MKKAENSEIKLIDVVKTVEVFKNFNINTSYFRPAYQEETVKNITENLTPGSIILFHKNRIKPQTLETVIKGDTG
ncbi:hypothetical protein [Persephonella sp.]